MPQEITLAEAQSPAERAQAFEVRRRVFVVEQGISPRLEFDHLDDQARHVLAKLDDHPVGTLRLRLVDQGRVAKIERVAVLAEARGRAIGRRLILEALMLAGSLGATSALLHAQTRAADFYRPLGFEADGPTFVEDGILHVTMTRTVSEGTPTP